MIRLVTLLCVGLYLGLMVLGQDHGQKRNGLMMADKAPKKIEAPQQVAATEVVFIPAQPVMQPAKLAPTPVVANVSATATATATETLPAPEIPGGQLFTVATNQANVREGPGRIFGVVGSLSRGEQVLVVEDPQAIDGWSKIRIEGDGIEGFIATKLLTVSQ